MPFDGLWYYLGIALTPHHTGLSTQFNIAGGQLFASTYGHVGLAPGLAKLDDVLCFIRGARVPFVLRPGLNQRYRLVGDCYIRGLMHGEVESLELAVEDILLG